MGKADEVILADGDKFDRVGESVITSVIVDIGGDELLGGFCLEGNDSREEFTHADGMGSLGVVKVQAILGLLDVDGVLVSTVLEDELLKVEEGTLMRDLLPDLDHGLPSVGGHDLGAIFALHCADDVLNLKLLLKDGGGKNLLLDGQLDLDTPGVRLSPEESCVNQTNLVQTT